RFPHHERHGVWVPAFAGTTVIVLHVGATKSSAHQPCKAVIARSVATKQSSLCFVAFWIASGACARNDEENQTERH
ncbi:MAG: hypothetical protein WBH00_11315, partial [Xanthobacteraceae bacterium]